MGNSRRGALRSPVAFFLISTALLACASPQKKLELAVALNQPARVRKLPADRVDPNAANEAGVTPLFMAASHGNPELVGLLLDRGADPLRRGPRGATPLMAAADPETARLLLDRGADIDAQDDDGRTALMRAAAGGGEELVSLFLERGADVEAKDLSGKTALAQAAPAAAAALEEAERKALETDLSPARRADADGRPERALEAYAAALRRATPGTALELEIRGDIVRAAAAMPEPPAMPEEARGHVVKSQFLLRRGGDPERAEAELRQALDAAPWWADGYYNLGLIQSGAGRFKEAMATLRMFLAAAPSHPQAAAAQDRIYELEISQEQVDRIDGLSGNWTRAGSGARYSVSVSNGKLRVSGEGFLLNASVDKDRIEGTVEGKPYPGPDTCTIPGQMHPATGRISADAKSIEFEFVWSRYQTNSHCVNMAGMPSNCCLLCSKVCDGVHVVATTNTSVRLTRP